MARKIAVICLWLGLASPAGVSALGLGDIQVRSALNQPLDAEVELIAATAVELEELEVTLAPRETFERLGLDRSAFLSGLEFDVVRGERGEPVLHVTSDRPVSEPFLTFLIEARWPRGRLLREYTVLLDPPVYLTDDAAQARVAEPPSSRSARTPTASGPVTRRTQPAESAPARTPRGVSQSESGRTFDGEYGPIERNETLWTIANRLRAGAGVSVNQMMIALYRANPEAFGGNINLLLAGAVLQVPDAGAFEALAAREADTEVERQNITWQEGSRTVAAGSTEIEPAGGRLRLVPAADEASAEADAGRPGRGAAERGGDGQAEALRSQVDELQTQLDDAERLLELKDSELAALQERMAALEAAGGEEAAPGADLETGMPEEPAAQPTPAARTVPVAPPPATGPRQATVRDSQGFGDTLAGIFGSTWLYVGLGIALLLAAMLIFARRRRTEAVENRWQSLDEDEEEPAVPVAQLSTTQTLRALPDEDESFVVVEQGPRAAGRRQPSAKARAAVLEPAPSEGDDTLSSATAVDLDQADPLAEADFHMAYGLYDQAAELVRKASREEPTRRDLRMKLLEIYFVWGNEQAFLEEAQELRDSLGGQPDADWDKVLIMGKQICPDEPLFAGDPGAAGARSGDVDLDLADSGAGEATVDFVTRGEEHTETELDLDLGGTFDESQPLEDTSNTRAGGSDPDMLDFDFADEVEEEPRAPRDEGSTIEASGFDSPTLETPTLEQPGPESPTVESPTLESARYEDTTVETPTIEQRVEAARGAGASDQTAEIDLDDLGLDLENLRGDSIDGSLDDEEETMLADLSGFDAPQTRDETASDDFDATLTTPAGRARDLDVTTEAPHIGRTPSRDRDATSELSALDPDELDIDLEGLSAALELSDTAEHRRPAGDTVRQPRRVLDEAQDEGGEFLDVDMTEMLSEDADAFAATGVSGAPDFDLDDMDESEADSEVGTKLDLARAYMDMGDPDGANSILQEVLEEGDASQREEAHRLLNALP